MPQTYSGGGPEYSGGPQTSIGGSENGHRFHKDEPTTELGWQNSETQAEPYLKI